MFFQPSAFPQTHLQTPSNPQITTGLSTIQCEDFFLFGYFGENSAQKPRDSGASEGKCC